MPKPTCGPQGESTDDTLKVILAIWGMLGTAGSVYGILSGAAGKTFALLGVVGPQLVWLAAAVAALATLITVFAFYWDRCLQDPEGMNACSAGVVNEIAKTFSDTSEQVFWFTAMHPRVDVVVKSMYWDLVQQLALHVKCALDPDESPIMQCFYRSAQVCAIGLGSTIGAAVGAAVGILAGVAIAAAIGCAGSGIFYVLCFVIVMLIAAIVAVIITLIGASIGGGIAGSVVGEAGPTAESGNVLQVGDYVSTFGNLITYGNLEGARVYWFVERTVTHGRSTGSPQFSYTDPDNALTDPATNLPIEACPPRVVIE